MTFPDVETLLITQLTQWLKEDGWHNATVVSFVPDSKTLNDEIASGKRIVRVQRVGGQERARVLDAAIVQITAIADTRATSQKIMSRIRTRLNGYYGTTVIDGVDNQVMRSAEIKAPLQIPDLNPDARRVNATFEVVTRKLRSTNQEG